MKADKNNGSKQDKKSKMQKGVKTKAGKNSNKSSKWQNHKGKKVNE